MSVNPFELAAPKKELPKELQALFDDYFVHYIAGLNCYGDCKASDEAADKALKKLIGYLCAQKGLPADGLEEGRGEYVIYLSDDRKLEKSVAVDFEMLDYSEDLGEISFSLDARYRNDSAQDWKEKLKLKASPQAQEKLKVFREEEERKRTAEGKERRMQYDKYLPGALSFLRSHGNGLIKHDDWGPWNQCSKTISDGILELKIQSKSGWTKIIRSGSLNCFIPMAVCTTCLPLTTRYKKRGESPLN
jgi:hypothetical protein